jgi:hypothetical protein
MEDTLVPIEISDYPQEMVKRHLAQAERHVVRANLNIRRLRSAIKTQERIGCDTTEACWLKRKVSSATRRTKLGHFMDFGA